MDTRITLGILTIASCGLLILVYAIQISVYQFGFKPDVLVWMTMYARQAAMALWIVILLLTLYYVYCMFRHLDLTGELKFLWLVSMFFAGYLVLPVFWYLHIWKAKQD